MGGKHSAPEENARSRDRNPPSLQDAAGKMDNQILNLEAKISKTEEDAKQWVAKAATNPTAKARAMQCLKMKKQYEQQRDQLMGTQFNLENMAFQQEQADVTSTAVSALAAGRDQMKLQQQKINVESVERLTDDIADLAGEMAEIQNALAGSALAGGAADSELEAEWNRMQEEEAMRKLMNPGTAAPAAAAASASASSTAAVPAASAPAPLPA